MSSGPFICYPFGNLVHHFESSVTELPEASDEQFNVQGRPFNDQSRDLEARAMEVMLKYLAQWLLKMHKALATDTQSFFKLFTSSPKLFYQLVSRRLQDIESDCHNRLFAYPHGAVPMHWRQIYSDVQILGAYRAIIMPLTEQRTHKFQELAFLKALDEVVMRLDKALFIGGGAGRILGIPCIHKAMDIIAEYCVRFPSPFPRKNFYSGEPHGRPALTSPCERHHGWDLARFEMYMSRGLLNASETGETGPQPVVFTDLTRGKWPAFERWCKPQYFFRITLDGRRLVFVDMSPNYVDASCGQELVTFEQFLKRHIDVSLAAPGSQDGRPPPWVIPPYQSSPRYLAPHDLFQQIPGLCNDILAPDFCRARLPATAPNTGSRTTPRLDMPMFNAWFTPPGATSHLYSDSCHNLLCQIVGTKYVRLYPPQASELMRPMTSFNGIDLGNTSIDVLALAGWFRAADDGSEEAQERMRELRDRFKDVEHFECILQPGDTLFIPIGWWYFMWSLSVSFTVRFWWN